MTIELAGGTLLFSGKPDGNGRHVAVGASGGGGDASGFSPASGISVTGTIADGETVTFTKSGGGFGTKPGGAGPMWWLDYGAGQITPGVGSRITQEFTPETKTSISTTTRSAPNRSSALFLDEQDGSSHTTAGTISTPDGETAEKYFRFIRQNLGFDGADLYAVNTSYNGKYFRQGISNQNNTFIAYGQANAADGNPRVSTERTPSNSYPNRPGLDEFKGQWKTLEFRAKQNADPNVNDGIWRILIQGEKAEENTAWYFTDSDTPDYSDNMATSIIQPFGTGAQHWFDFDYYDNSWARVFAVGISNYDETQIEEVELQIPQSWSDTEVEVYLRAGVFGSLSGKHLFAMTHDEQLIYLGEVS